MGIKGKSGMREKPGLRGKIGNEGGKKGIKGKSGPSRSRDPTRNWGRKMGRKKENSRIKVSGNRGRRGEETRKNSGLNFWGIEKGEGRKKGKIQD